MASEKADVVRKGYDILAKRYHRQRDFKGQYPNKRLLERFVKALGKKGSVLDLGCGAGVPVARFLVAKGNAVTGIDFSKEMVKLARKNVPRAKFILGDITKMRFKSDSFDGAISFYAIIHIPRKKHEGIYKNLRKILKPDGLILANASGSDEGEYYGEFMGERMFWSYWGPVKTIRIMKKAGFEVLWSKVLKLGGETQFWVLARNDKS